MNHHINPPFRAEQVGSLLRPPKVQAARRRHAEGDLSASELRELEDIAITEIVRRQEEVGMRDITDGELRRAYFHLDFLQQLDGVTVTGGIGANKSAKSAGDGFKPPQLSVTGKLAHARPIQVKDFTYLDSRVSYGTAKVAIPSPTMVHFRGGRAAIDIEAYPEMDAFFADLAACYRDEIAALHAVGCRYLQLDDTNLAYLCDPEMRQAAADRGDDPNELPRQYAALINDALADRPADLTVGIHLCRGNYRSTWFAKGGYEPVAEVLFNELDVDAYFLEYDDERSGDFAPLRFVPKHKTVVLGLVSSKVAELEPVDLLAKRLDEAAAYVPLEQLCLSPQCGFSSTAEGNEISAETQWAKLARVVETAHTVWGD